MESGKSQRKWKGLMPVKTGRETAKRVGFLPFFALFSLIFFLCVITGCRKVAREEADLPPRPSRGYVHWLGKQAMHNRATELLAQVSQSERMWLNSGGANHFEVLLEAAPTWVLANAPDSAQGAFSRLAEFVPRLPAMGINGLYLGETGESGSLWLDTPEAGVISLDFDPQWGDGKSFAALRQNAESSGVELGSDLLGAATGLGPDFILQTRASPESNGIYALLEIPREGWNLLPQAKNDWEGVPLTSEMEAKFAQAGLLPGKLARDSLAWASPEGWAVTGEIMGLDGKNRRWLYRYAKTPATPILMWTDPFGQARRILAAAVIQQTGLQGQTLTGLRLEPLFGLEPEIDVKTDRQSLAPGLDALNDLAGQIHRYGGWAIQADALPAQIVKQILAGECDFCADDSLEMMALASLFGASAERLVKIYQDRLKEGLDFRRLAHGLNAARLLPFTTCDPTTVHLIRQNFSGKIPSFSNLAASQKEFLALFNLGQPGLAFLAPEMIGQNAAGISPSWLLPILKARKQHRLAEGKLISIFKNGKNAFALLTRLPDDSHWLTLLNFTGEPVAFSITLPFTPNHIQALSLQDQKYTCNESKFNLTLDGTQCINVIFS